MQPNLSYLTWGVVKITKRSYRANEEFRSMSLIKFGLPLSSVVHFERDTSIWGFYFLKYFLLSSPILASCRCRECIPQLLCSGN